MFISWLCEPWLVLQSFKVTYILVVIYSFLVAQKSFYQMHLFILNPMNLDVRQSWSGFSYQH